MKKLTDRQRMVLDYIISSLEEHGYPPTIREIGEFMEISSTNGVNDHLKALERKGYLLRDQSKSRALRPLMTSEGRPYETGPSSSQDHSDIVTVPLVGSIAAGNPIEAINETEDQISIGEGLLGAHRELFALRIKGSSMIEDGILNGDIVFISRQRTAATGSIVAVMVDGEATVKRIYYEKDRIRLQPANSSMEPIYVHRAEDRELEILGRVVGVFRSLD